MTHFTFKKFLKEYHSITEEMIREKSDRAARRSGLKQYSAAASLIATHKNNTAESGWRYLKKIVKHFSTSSEPYTDTATGITVGKFNAADSATGSHDITMTGKDGKPEGVEVVGGGGKMFLSMRNHKPTTNNPTGITPEELAKRPGWASIAAEYQRRTKRKDGTVIPGVEDKIEDTTNKPFRRLGSAFARDIVSRKHVGMEDIERNMTAKHWMIGDHLIPVGSLSHFVHRMSTTQGSPKSPRLAVRVSNIIDPTKTGTGEAKKIATEKNWHIQLNTMLHGYTPEQLSQYGITRVRNIN
jgi:hypothetical protein